MPSIDRPLSGQALHFRLGDGDRSELIDRELVDRAGRSARTLVKDGPLRVTLIAVREGGRISPHVAPGPITLHVLSGTIRLRAAERSYDLEAGDLLSLGPGVRHAVESDSGGVFLLTVVAEPDR